MNLIETTLVKFKIWAESHNADYAILRNYEALPNIGNDLDIAMDVINVDQFRKSVKNGYFKEWQYINEVTAHNSNIEVYNIYIFRFYSLNTGEFMQIDFFQGFSIKGIPFFNVKELLLHKREYRSYNIVCSDTENLIKYFQIYNAIINNQENRIEKYCVTVLKDKENKHLSKLNISSSYLNSFLEKKEFKSFKKEINKLRYKHIISILSNNSLFLIKNFYNRVLFFVKLYIKQDFVYNLMISNNTNIDLLEKTLNDFKKRKIIRAYLIQSSKKYNFIIYIKKWKEICNHGGIIIKLKSLDEEDANKQLKHYIYMSIFKKEISLFKL